MLDTSYFGQVFVKHNRFQYLFILFLLLLDIRIDFQDFFYLLWLFYRNINVKAVQNLWWLLYLVGNLIVEIIDGIAVKWIHFCTLHLVLFLIELKGRHKLKTILFKLCQFLENPKLSADEAIDIFNFWRLLYAWVHNRYEWHGNSQLGRNRQKI